MILMQKIRMILLMAVIAISGGLSAQIEYLPSNLYSDNIDTNIHHLYEYFDNPTRADQPTKSLNMLGSLIQHYLIKSETEKAEELVDKYLVVSFVNTNALLRASLLFWKANIYRYQNHMPEALACYF